MSFTEGVLLFAVPVPMALGLLVLSWRIEDFLDRSPIRKTNRRNR